ncbi:MAG TPA: DUF4019 domain-containing protein [Candidatus Omnitrophota bacterium]|nr:DUF4019 domain-containing protein [Candidatus Omnitrophota bacterium]
MILKNFFTFGLIALTISIPVYSWSDEARNGDEITGVALKWLGWVDEGRDETSWKDAAKAFQQEMAKEKWKANLKALRTRLGKLRERSLATLTYYEPTNTVPLSCVLYFTSVFEHLTVRQEILFLIYDNNQWKVAGYFVHFNGGEHGS